MGTCVPSVSEPAVGGLQHWRQKDARGNHYLADLMLRQITRDWQRHAGDSAIGGGKSRLPDLAIESHDRRRVDNHPTFSLYLCCSYGARGNFGNDVECAY